jgi:GDP-mannose 6-dehydrogenase
MKLSIFGLGYVGSVTLGCLARNGHEVIGVDINEAKVDLINSGKSPIVEKDMDSIITECHRAGKISATNSSIDAVKNSDVSFICVGTPSGTNGHSDLTSVYNVVAEIARGVREKNTFHVVVIRSTVPPGTNRKVSEIMVNVSGKIAGKDFAVVSNPEFLREGCAAEDFYTPPYTLVGTKNHKAIEKIKAIYEKIQSPFVVTEPEIAEMVKYINNAFHALKITFANEIGNVCKKLNIDSHQLMEIFCLDTKLNISSRYFKPGFAYGGSCLPKDLKALKTMAHDNYLVCPVLENIERSNDLQKELVFKEILTQQKQKIGFLGLSFKAGTDDLRESPIIDIIERLLGKGFDIKIYDKHVHLSRLIGANREYILKKIPYISTFITNNLDEIIDHSELIVIVNREQEFHQVLNSNQGNKIIYDLVNLRSDGDNLNPNYIGIAW